MSKSLRPVPPTARPLGGAGAEALPWRARRRLAALDGWSALSPETRMWALALLAALALQTLPHQAVRSVAWTTAVFFHEAGHALFGWAMGCPSLPAVSWMGHAASFHYPQAPATAVALAAFVGLWVLRGFTGPGRGPLRLAIAPLWLTCIFLEPLRRGGILAAGHLGEVAFGALFLWRARTGAALERPLERPLYAFLGLFLVLRTFAFGLELVTCMPCRAAYASGGSYGLDNDLVHLAALTGGAPLAPLGAGLALVALLAGLLAFLPRLQPLERTPTRYPLVRLARSEVVRACRAGSRR